MWTLSISTRNRLTGRSWLGPFPDRVPWVNRRVTSHLPENEFNTAISVQKQPPKTKKTRDETVAVHGQRLPRPMEHWDLDAQLAADYVRFRPTARACLPQPFFRAKKRKKTEAAASVTPKRPFPNRPKLKLGRHVPSVRRVGFLAAGEAASNRDSGGELPAEQAKLRELCVGELPLGTADEAADKGSRAWCCFFGITPLPGLDAPGVSLARKLDFSYCGNWGAKRIPVISTSHGINQGSRFPTSRTNTGNRRGKPSFSEGSLFCLYVVALPLLQYTRSQRAVQRSSRADLVVDLGVHYLPASTQR